MTVSEFLNNITSICKRVKSPKENFIKPQSLSLKSKKISQVKTKAEPKQVCFDPERKQAFVSCMRGKAIQIFSLENDKLSLESEIPTSEQCVEIELSGPHILATTTNFKRGPLEKSFLYIIDAKTGQVISKTKTGGAWSKVVKKHPKKSLVFISNWHSNNISIIDISNPKNPQLKQLISCGKSPRGIAFAPNGKVLVAGYYSRHLHVLKETGSRYKIISNHTPFKKESYRGNLRDVIVDTNNKYAYISNMGKNTVHKLDLEEESFRKSIRVGKYPNSIRLTREGNLLLASCRESNTVYFIDPKKMKLTGRSETTGKKPTGLAPTKDGFLITAFSSNKLEYHKLNF